jgi:hypothetical protein
LTTAIPLQATGDMTERQNITTEPSSSFPSASFVYVPPAPPVVTESLEGVRFGHGGIWVETTSIDHFICQPRCGELETNLAIITAYPPYNVPVTAVALFLLCLLREAVCPVLLSPLDSPERSRSVRDWK